LYTPQLSLEEIREQALTDIVSLGGRCATAHNLRRHFNFMSAMPFDWWISRSLSGVLSDFDIDKLYNPDLLEVTFDKLSVRHKEYGLLLHHEFPRDKATYRVVPDFRDYLAVPKLRTASLFSKFKRLNSFERRIVFYREGELESDVTRVISDMLPSASCNCLR
jgi:hypothetical protein